jgi:hypothetical protein
MARELLDHTGQESMDRTLGKLNDMLAELFAASSTTPTPSVTSLTASGAVQGATVVGTTSVTGAVVNSTGLATAGSVKVDTGTKTATASGGAATLSKNAGVITSEALTTAAGAAYTLTLTNTTIAAADQVMASLQNGSNTQGIPIIERVTPGAGSVVIVVRNLHASEALNGTLKIAFVNHKN